MEELSVPLAVSGAKTSDKAEGHEADGIPTAGGQKRGCSSVEGRKEKRICPSGEVRKAIGRFGKSTLNPGDVQFGPGDGKQGSQGYSLPDNCLQDATVELTPMGSAESLSLEHNGVTRMNVQPELEAAGISERNFDPSISEHRRAVGSVLLAALEKRFNKRALHLADTSRISPGAVYGEATVRDTGSKTLRSAHHGFHVDKFWPGVRQLYGSTSEEDSVLATIHNYSKLWDDDWKCQGVSQQAAAHAMRGAGKASDGCMVNAWVALTPGSIEQHPLAFIDKSSFKLECNSVATMPVIFPNLSDTITLVKENILNDNRGGAPQFLWLPSMQFGEVFVFLTASTPHSAVRLEGVPDSDSIRRSAEMRVLLLNR